ncbi:hypothetical protein EV356DRAFT_488053 [Viridothelium virens]|uniref:ARM repeat-containing protein n=1 Tax=Viridothelium virens TaxID=1048519 RepID=A0A6A6H3H1_VIRVR|nr:hypothetical protein EV356DRAFT_488053 [Viridothelium virens]
MAPTSRPEHHINLNYLPQLGAPQPRSGSSTAATSPIEPPAGTAVRYPMGTPGNSTPSTSAPAGQRVGAASPSKEYGNRLFPKRAREIQAQEGLGAQPWGPPTSGNSTPLRETIPESPNDDSFPDFESPGADTLAPPSSGRRMRAGTLPSKFSPNSAANGAGSQASGASGSYFPKVSRPTPSTSPFQAGLTAGTDPRGLGRSNSTNTQSSLLSRIRAGSMPQRTSLNSSSTPFGSSMFSTSWNTARDRAGTLTSIRSSDAPSSPAQSSFSRDSLADGDVKTLDYLGLVDTPQQTRANLANTELNVMMGGQQNVGLQPASIAELASLSNALNNRNANRFRSFSVNAKEKYGNDMDDYGSVDQYAGSYSGTLTPSGENGPSAADLQEMVRQHNLEVQAFANLASASRPRARTAGVLDSPTSRGVLRNYVPTPSRLDSSISASDLTGLDADYSTLTEAVQGMHLGGNLTGEENALEGPTRALWLGNIPASTTNSSLDVIFANFGEIESTRVLTQKNCGFINFKNLQSAVQAKTQLNGKEIFPGAGPVRIGFAKVPSATGTPGNDGTQPSPSPDPFGKTGQATAGASSNFGISQSNGINAETAPAALATPDIRSLQGDIAQIVKDFGATDDEQARIAEHVNQALSFDDYESEIPAISEPSHNRMHDAPRLREIRKRIDNNTCSQPEIENIAMDMLPEIAELSSDYLGNTVVQKLFEFCSEPVKEAMLAEIAPHLAEIGVHKNGTWAAQKIIDVARTPNQMQMIVNNLRPYGVASFLDQYGNYVMQCCLRFQYPLNDFIFDVMLTRLWEIAQGRFGARAMRACLESHYATKDQQRMMAAAIALHSVQLATNANGALLLTWFLDTCTFPRRRTVLAPRLVPHLVHLCTHKVAYLTVLKIINQRNEPEARDTILQALFFSPNDQTLYDILSDQTCGATLIFKVLTTPFFDEKIRQDVVQNVRNVLLRLKANPAHGYKRLMDEVQLPTRNAAPSREYSDSSRPVSKQGAMNGITPQPTLNTQFNQQFMPNMQQQQFDPNLVLQRTNSVDSTGFEHQNSPFGVNMNGMSPATPVSFPGQPMNMSPVTPQQLQYQQALLAANQRQGSYFPPGMNGMNGMNGINGVNGMGAMNTMNNVNNMNGFAGAAPGMGAGMGNPNQGMMNQQPTFSAPPGFNPMMQTQGGMYGYPMGYANMQGQSVGAGQRRGRVSAMPSSRYSY